MERIISLSAVGSLKEEHRPLDFVLPDQFFDRTRGRVSTFFGEGLVAHVSFADPICGELAGGRARPAVPRASTRRRGGTYLCMEGPAFSTKAESNVYRSWGMDVIGMTNLQEAKLAREAEICYVTVAMVTDYDCWHPEHDAVTVSEIIGNLMKNAENACEGCRGGSRGDAGGRDRANAASALKHALITNLRGPSGDPQEAGVAGWQVPRRLSFSPGVFRAIHGATSCCALRWPKSRDARSSVSSSNASAIHSSLGYAMSMRGCSRA